MDPRARKACLRSVAGALLLLLPAPTPRPAPIHLGAPCLSRSGSAPREAGPPTRQADGSITRAVGAAVEELRPERGGIEQSFRFDAEPAGVGPLTVRVPVSRPETISQREGGLQLDGLHYGAATWRDADARETSLALDCDGDAIVITVPGELLASSRYPAVLDPLVSGEYALDTPVLVAAASGQDFPAAAFDGTQFLVVWQDGRDRGRIFGARVAPSGALLDVAGLPIGPLGLDQRSPAVSAGGGVFLVVWSSGGSIFGTRVSPGGAVLDSPALTLSPQSFAGPSVAFDGARFLVIWDGTCSGVINTICGRRVDPAGTLLDASPVAITSLQFQQNVQAAGADGGFFVVWEDFRNSPRNQILGVRVLDDGTIVDTTPIAISASTFSAIVPAVAAGNGGDYLVTWYEESSTSAMNIVAKHVANGIPSSPLITVAMSNPATDVSHVAFDGTRYLVTWSQFDPGGPVFGARVAGTLLDPTPLSFTPASPNTAGDVQVTASPGRFFVAWTSTAVQSGDSDVLGTLVEGSTGALDAGTALLSISANAQTDPAIAFDGTRFLIAWSDTRSGAGDIYAVLADPSGRVLGAPLLLSSSPAPDVGPAVATDGTRFVVAWISNAGTPAVLARRVSSSGTVLDAAPVVLGSTVRTTVVSLAAIGPTFLIAWDNDTSIAAVHFDGVSGTKLDAPFAPVRPLPLFAPAVGSDGTKFVVVWGEDPLYGVGSTELHVASVSAATPAFSSDTFLRVSDGGFLGGNGVGLAFDGTAFLAAWMEPPTAVTALRFRADGTLLDAAPLTVGATSATVPPDVVFDGTRYLLAWDSYLSPVLHVEALGTQSERLGGVDVTDPGGQDTGEPRLAVTRDGGLLMYTRFDASPTVQAFRARARWIDWGLDGGVQQSDAGQAGDAGTSDAGAKPDGGASPDGGPARLPDGGLAADAGTADAGSSPRVVHVGCGCSDTRDLGSLWLVLIIVTLARAGARRGACT